MESKTTNILDNLSIEETSNLLDNELTFILDRNVKLRIIDHARTKADLDSTNTSLV